MRFKDLTASIAEAHTTFQASAVRAVNSHLCVRNWVIGCFIAEFELNGVDRAAYGDGLIDDLAKRLSDIKGCSRRNLYLFKQFYLLYPQLTPLISNIIKELEIVQTVSAQFTPIVQTLSAQSLDAPLVPAEKLLGRLGFSHFTELINIKDAAKRTFYEIECIKGTWSVRELRRQIHAKYYERSAASSDPAKLSQLTQAAIVPAQPTTIVKDVYTFEFLGLPGQQLGTEGELEHALLDHLQEFMLELGHGFCFEARQKRILIGDQHFFIDMVFYHRILKCHVLIELKLGEFTHADAGQLNTYLNYWQAEEMQNGDQSPIGILLVSHKNEALVKYATTGMAEHLFVQRYLTKLPSPESLQDYLRRELDRLD